MMRYLRDKIEWFAAGENGSSPDFEKYTKKKG
jgi:hypothetical protein